jgi:tRNA uridine 5-carboxymethylaminomethyl modification enzyme
MTSRAEYRLALRQDNADLRLTEKGYKVGLVTEERYNKFLEKKDQIRKEVERIRQTAVRPSDELNEILKAHDSSPLTTGCKLADLIKRSELNYEILAPVDKRRKELPKSVVEEAEIQIKYEGYIKLQQEQIDEFKQLENKKLSPDIDYNDIKGLCLEARQKLNKQKPLSVGQASRISGVSPADISVLLIYLSQNK